MVNIGYEGLPLRDILEKFGNRDYEYIQFRCLWRCDGCDYDEYFGCCSYKNGELIPLDGDSYSLDDKYIRAEEGEFEGGVGLTVWEVGMFSDDIK